MKSIKEKSNEYAREFVEPFVLYYTKDEVRQFEAQHEDSFEAGANYVVEEIEKLVKTTIGEGETYHYNLYIGLVNLLEQLKK